MTENEKIQELLKPRYKVIVKYPNSPYKVGQVLSTVTTLSGKQFLSGQTFHPDNFPDIFRRLEWWEDRRPEEMPEYVKWDYKRDVDHPNMQHHLAKVEGWQQENFGVITNGQVTATKFWMPATSAEYQAFISKTENQE